MSRLEPPSKNNLQVKQKRIGKVLKAFLTRGMKPVPKFNEFELRLKFPKNPFQLSAGLNLEKLNTILSGSNPYLSCGLNLSLGSIL